MTNLKFNRYCVTDGKVKARVWYSLDSRIDGRKAVTLYSKDYGHALGALFGEDYRNDTDISTDYFEKGRVVLFEDNRHYAAARARAEANLAVRAVRAERAAA